MVHSLSGVTLAQDGRLDEAMAALRHAERLALMAHAGDVVAIVCGNQANVAMMQHRHDQAMALAERSVELQEEAGTPHGLGIALASLGQICVRLGNLTRAEQALNRALDVRSPLQFMRETTGAVFDTLAQIHLIRGNHEEASRCLQRSREAYGEYGAQTSRWYQWSVRVLEARVALRRGDAGQALDIATEIARAQDAPAGYATQADLVAVEALLASQRQEEAERAARGARSTPRGLRHERHVGRVPSSPRPRPWTAGPLTEAYHDFGQSVSVFELLGERYQAGLSYLELGKLAGAAGARSRATRYLTDAVTIFEALRRIPIWPRRARLSQCAGIRDRRVRRRADGRRRCARAADRRCVGDARAPGQGRDDRAARGLRRPSRGHFHPAKRQVLASRRSPGCDPKRARSLAGAASAPWPAPPRR